VGKVEQSVGERVGNQKLATKGVVNQVKGAAKETWGDAKDAAKQIHESHKKAASERAPRAGRSSASLWMTRKGRPKTEEAAKLNDQAAEVFDQGTRDRQFSDEYVRVTVTLATVLLLMAISQRFKIRGVRLGLLAIAALLLCFPVYHILTLPRA
jgi:uncharacterized protein YjbJ (UPF0337 family)